MKVILLDNVAKVGRKYEVKNVSDGYALNFLIPKQLAKIADSKSLKSLEKEMEAYEQARKDKEEALLANMGKLESSTLKFEAKANAKGHLFAAIHKDEIVSELSKQVGLEVDPEFIELEKPIKEVGEHEVSVKVGEKTTKLKLEIGAE